MPEDWKFDDPPNVAVFASRKIVFEGDWIYYVCHHRADGAWEFHSKSGISPTSELAVVGLKTIVELDPSVAELAGLPPGWCAWRDEKGSPWRTQPKE